MATVYHLNHLNNSDIPPAQETIVKTFAVWLTCAREDTGKDFIKRTTNVMLDFSDEDGNHIGNNRGLMNHPRMKDLDDCVFKGMKLLMNHDTVEFRSQILKSGINVIRLLYDDRRRGLTGGINFMITKEWMDAGGKKEDAKNHPHKYTLLLNIRERKNQKCHHPDCDKVSNKFQPCEGCMNVVYCSEECHRANWNNHKGDCKGKPKHSENL